MKGDRTKRVAGRGIRHLSNVVRLQEVPVKKREMVQLLMLCSPAEDHQWFLFLCFFGAVSRERNAFPFLQK